jgi:isoquinoline 1-oxidoreductase subunit beta
MSGPNISRRSFLVTVGAGTVSVVLGGVAGLASAAEYVLAPSEGARINAWVTVADDGVVTIISPSAEMGQGVLTASPLLVAEDLDADWSRVRVLQAPADMVYGNPIFGGVQVTGGSATTPGYYSILRLAGAQTRLVLRSMAASLLGVDPGEIRSEPHRMIHDATGKSLDFGEIVRRGVMPDPIPEATEADLKPASAFRYIGRRDIPRIEVPSKVDGSAVYGVDVEFPGMLHGTVLRPPVQHETPVAVDDAAARAVPGIRHIVTLPYGIGVIGDSVPAIQAARERLVVEWSQNSPARHYTSDTMLIDYETIARDVTTAGGVALDEGNALTELQDADRIVEASYLIDHVYHATMEPMVATAQVDGDRVTIWAPTQAQSLTTWVAAGILDIPPENVTLITTLLGGGLGRKAEGDFISDAVSLAREVEGRPVKVIWTREDDVRHGKFRPLVATHARLGLAQDGHIGAWHQRLVADSIYARWYPDGFAESEGMDDVVYGGLENGYALSNHRTEYLRRDSGVDVSFFRGTAEGYTKFSVESLMDEAAALAGQDPLEFRLAHLAHDPRAQDNLRALADMAGWGEERPEGRSIGLAYSHAWGAHCSQATEVSLNTRSGEITVHRIWCALDPGLAIQPINIEAQISGAILMGVSVALHEHITIVNGEVIQSNFDNYRVMRMSEAPEIEVRITPTDNRPAGIGEIGVPPVAPAIANAIARLPDGPRLRRLPMLPERVLAALNT